MTTCTLHRVETNLTCRTCGTPVCSDCAVRTAMGVSCAEHAGGAKKDAVAATKRRGRSGPDRRVLVGALAVILVAAAVIFLRPSGGNDEPEAAQGAWTPLPSAGLVARADFSSVSTGTAMIVWGGAADRPLADGAAYDLPSSTWKPVAAAPISARRGHSAVWTGTSMIVFGGRGPAQGCGRPLCTLNDGAAYDPAADRWSPIAPAPIAGRNGHTAVWFQDRMVVWGGAVEGGAAVADGASYDPASNTWTPLPPAPLEPRVSHRAVASAHRLLVWGGSSEAEEGGKYLADGAIYSPATNTWTPMAPYPQTTEPAARDTFSSVWTGTHMLVWGGFGRTADCRPCLHDDGAAYELSSNSWTLMTPSPLAGRGNHRAVWTGKEMVVWGGFSTTELNDGAAYNPASDTWTQLPVSPILGRQGQAMELVGDNLIVWGGHGPHGEGETRNPNHDDGAILSLRS